MDISLERGDGTAFGSLFQQIINDMKNSSPLWEDFMVKASKLHACLRATIQAIAAYLDAFQKIADAATNSRGATKEIGTALTRVCLRHKAVETRMKTFTTAIMDCLILPLQDKFEEWKRQVAVIDKDHAKEHKRCRTELKKRSNDTLRLQKKARKGQTDTIQSLVENSMADINQKRAELEEVERKSLRAVMIEERIRYCTFVNLLQPVVKEECEVMYELGHLQEAMDSIAIVTKEPTILPQSSEELILESKTSINLYPESPGGSNSHGYSNSLGSRKSSVCSISSMNSSGSSGSPGHQYQRSISQLISPALRLKPGESSDSGFCSSSALTSQTSTTSTNPTHAVSTWPPHTQDVTVAVDRPHTISSAYEKGHQRPALTVYTFQNPEIISEAQKSPANILCRPPLPIRCSSLERPLSSAIARNQNVQTPRQCPSPLPSHLTKEHPIFQPTYVNMSELASMAASKITNNSTNQPQPQQPIYQQPILQPQPQQPINSPVLSIASSLVSSDSSATNHQSSPDVSAATDTASTPQINSPHTNDSSLAQTPVTAPLTSGGGDDIDNTSSDNTNPFSPENDFKSTGSVLEKLSMFEKIQNNIIVPPPAAIVSKPEVIVNRKNEEIYKAIGSVEKDPDQIYEDSIQELNNLIGELDSFQKEHEQQTRIAGPTAAAVANNRDKDCDSNYDRISVGSSNIGSLGYSIQSNNSSESKFTYNEQDVMKYFNENSSGFESNESEIIHIHEPNCIETDVYLKENTEIIELRRKDSSTTELHKIVDDSTMANGDAASGQQRFSSFRQNYNDTNGRSSATPPFNRGAELSVNCMNGNSTSGNNLIDFKMSLEERLRMKPIISPRPASLSGCVSRITRRSSVNTMKPPPPVRRSSSVTPSHHGALPNSPSLSQQNLMNTSSESLPPPPAYLLDSSGRTSPGKVGETVKALTELRHMPASPGVIRRAQALAQMNQLPHSPPVQNLQHSHNYNNSFPSPPKIEHNVVNNCTNSPLLYTPPPTHSSSINPSSTQNQNNQNITKSSDSFNHHTYRSPNTTSSQSGIYAQPKQVSKMSSFRNPSPTGSTKNQNSNLMAQLNARISPQTNKQNEQQQNEKKIHAQNQSQQIYQIYDTRNNVQQQQQQQHTTRTEQKSQRSNHYQQQQQQHHNHTPPTSHQQHINEAIYTRAADRNHHYQQQQQQQQQQLLHQQQLQQQLQQQQQHYNQSNDDYSSPNYEKTTNTSRSKAKVGFLENLNAKLAEQRLSGKAFAVRSLINSKALPKSHIPVPSEPDPRICHESLMDQIKRGATLKRNKSINDRSAPKIH